MSVQAVCDRCGITMGAVTEKDSRDVEVYLGDAEEPYFVAEDLCPSCMEIIKSAIDRLGEPPIEMMPDENVGTGGKAAAKVRFAPDEGARMPARKTRPKTDYMTRAEVSDERA